jgi:hypothetical protein
VGAGAKEGSPAFAAAGAAGAAKIAASVALDGSAEVESGPAPARAAFSELILWEGRS